MKNRGFELEVEDGAGRGRRCRLPAAGRFRIGRDGQCDLVLEDARASKIHARIEPEGRGLVLTDLGSKNGVFVNGTRVGRQSIRAGDRIQIGEHVLCVRQLLGETTDAPALEDTIIDRKSEGLPRHPTEKVLLPDAIGPYKIIAKIADGGMGTVFLGHDESRTSVAIKVLRTDFAGSKELQGRFQQEIDLSRQLDHPNIVRFLDAGSDGSLQYLVSHYVLGTSAREVLQKGPVAIERAVEWGRQIASALEHAHARNIVHRDLKPANLLIEDAGDRIMILDFGLAGALNHSDARLTFTGQSMGTIQYASPEQLLDAKNVDARSDVYGLGACLYAFLTGLPPVRAKQAVKAMKEILSGEPYPLGKLRPGLDESIAAAIHRALAKDPGHRFASARQFLEALDSAQTDR